MLFDILFPYLFILRYYTSLRILKTFGGYIKATLNHQPHFSLMNLNEKNKNKCIADDG